MSLTALAPIADNLPEILEEADMERIPGNLYIARALRTASGFQGIFAAPGQPPRAVADASTKPLVFSDESTAEKSALFSLLADLNSASMGDPDYVARGEKADSGPGYIGLWAAPGMTPGIIREPDGRPSFFDNIDEAKAAAIKRIVDVLNKPRLHAGKTNKPERYTKLTAREFSEGLRLAGLTPSFFAFLYGTSQKRVLEWMDGSEDVPHPVRILLALFQDKMANVDIAQRVTEAVTEARQPPRGAR